MFHVVVVSIVSRIRQTQEGKRVFHKINNEKQKLIFLLQIQFMTKEKPKNDL